MPLEGERGKGTWSTESASSPQNADSEGSKGEGGYQLARGQVRLNTTVKEVETHRDKTDYTR